MRFDSPWQVLILLLVVVLLFGARRLPDLARSMGQSLKIFKSEVKDLRSDDEPRHQPPAAAGAADPGPVSERPDLSRGPSVGAPAPPPEDTADPHRPDADRGPTA